GPELSLWRWEHVTPRQWKFPAQTTMPDDAGAPRNRFAPISIPGMGHPSSLHWGSSPLITDLPAPAVWEAWWFSGDATDYQIRRRTFEVERPLGRYLIPHRLPAPFSLRAHPFPS